MRHADPLLRWSATLLGLSYVGLGGIFLLQPAALRPGISFPPRESLMEYGRFWEAYPAHAPLHDLLHVVVAFGALCGLSTVAGIDRALGRPNTWVPATGLLALLGFAVTLVANLRYLTLEAPFATAFAVGDAAERAALLAATLTLSLDPHGWLEFGGIGAWLLALNLTARRDGRWPRGLSGLGLLLAGLYACAVLASASGSLWLLDAAAALASVTAPAFYVWLGAVLGRGE